MATQEDVRDLLDRLRRRCPTRFVESVVFDGACYKDRMEAVKLIEEMQRERDRLQHKMEQYQLQLEDGWAAHIDKLNEVVVENAARREEKIEREFLESLEEAAAEAYWRLEKNDSDR